MNAKHRKNHKENKKSTNLQFRELVSLVGGILSVDQLRQ